MKNVSVLFIILIITLATCNQLKAEMTPTATATYLPTNTPTTPPTVTSTPRIEISNLLISREEINNTLSGNFYQHDFIVLQNEQEAGIHLFEGAYTSQTGGTIWVTLVKLPDGISCHGLTRQFASEAGLQTGTPLEIPNIYLADDIWMEYSKESNHISFGYSINEVCVNFEFDLVQELEPEEATAFLSVIAQKQMVKIQEAGY